jgi:hypothetical protein
MGLSEPIVLHFPISDYDTSCMGAIVALTRLLHQTDNTRWLVVYQSLAVTI